MTIDYTQVKRILTASEFSLVESARPTSIAAMKSSTLKTKINQARKQADKWTGQSISQNRASGKGPKDGNERTERKAEVFKEVLARFEKQLAKAEAAEAKQAAQKKASKPAKKSSKPAPKSKQARVDAAKTPLKKGAPDPDSAKVPDRAALSGGKARVQNTRVQQSGLNTRTLGHVSARGRRAQAARNAR